MATKGWVSVGEYESDTAADTLAASLTIAGVPNEVVSGSVAFAGPNPGRCIWVPPEWVERAKAILDEPAVPEDELTAQALRYSPLDDEGAEQPPGTVPPSPLLAGPSAGDRRPLLLLVLAGVAGIVLIRMILGATNVRSEEIAISHSPDGNTDAALLEIQNDAHGAHALRVCLRGHSQQPISSIGCTDVAYLSGVPHGSGQQGVELVWVNSSQLEIRYASAATATLYIPVFTWPGILARRSPRYVSDRTLKPIHIDLIHATAALDGG
jgi:hypothetical protein